MQAIEWCHFRVLSFRRISIRRIPNRLGLGLGSGVGVGFWQFEIQRNGIR